MKYDAIIFDLDGTLLNTLEDLCDSVNYALSQCGYPPRTLDEIRSFVGNGVGRLIHLSLPQDISQADEEKCFSVFKPYYAANSRNKTRPYDGIDEMLSAVKAAGFKTAVVSNKLHSQTQLLCSELFGSRIDVAVGQREGVKLKPAPDSVNYALGCLGVPASKAIYVGDSEVDAATAKNSNLPLIGVTWGFRGREVLESNHADFIIDSPAQLISIIVGKG